MGFNKRMEAGYFSTIATKLSAEDRAKLEIIANGFNMSLYELFQGLLLSLVRYFDIPSIVTHEHNAMMNAFANNLFALKGSFNPLSERGRKMENVIKAILLVERPKKKPQLISVCKNDGGILQESYNFETMLTDFLEAFDPEALQALKLKKDQLGYFSLTHALHEILMKSKPKPKDTIGMEIDNMFNDVRIPTGQEINKDIYYKQGYDGSEAYIQNTQA